MRNHSENAPRLVLDHLVTTGCQFGNCPTVYRTNRGTYVVQGFAVTPEQAGVDLPAGELLVEIPPELLAGVVRFLDRPAAHSGKRAPSETVKR